MTNLILLAEITAPHGLHGFVKVKCYAEAAENLKNYSPLQNADGTEQFTVTDIKFIGKIPAIKIKGINDRDTSETLRGTQLFVARTQLPSLPDGEYYHSDLIGLTAKIQNSNQVIGTITAIHNFGAGDLLEIKGDDKKSQLIPFNQNFIGEPDWQKRTLSVNLPIYTETEEDKAATNTI